jgi:hypothetical protein
VGHPRVARQNSELHVTIYANTVGVDARIVIQVARELFILFFCSAMAFFLGNGYYKSFRTGVLTVKGHTSRRDMEPISYWIGIAIGTFAFLGMVSGAAVMAFLVCMNLFGNSK